MCSGTEAGSCVRLIDSCITQLKAQRSSRTYNESKEEGKVEREEVRAQREEVEEYLLHLLHPL